MADPANSVAVATGSLVVTGTLTSFVAAEYDLFILGGDVAAIASRDSTTQITLKQPWGGDTFTGATTWEIANTGPYWQSTVATNKQLSDLLGKFEAGPIKWDASGPLSGRSTYNGQPKDFVYLSTDLPFTLYVKLANTNAASDWSAGQPLQLPAENTAAAQAARDLAQQAANVASGKADIATGAAGTATAQAGVAQSSAGTATGAASTAGAKADVATGAASTATGAAGTATAQAGVATVAAGTATTQAGVATTQAQQAAAARLVSEQARDAAIPASVTAAAKASEAAGSAASASASAGETAQLARLVGALSYDMGTLDQPSDGSTNFDMGTL